MNFSILIYFHIAYLHPLLRATEMDSRSRMNTVRSVGTVKHPEIWGNLQSCGTSSNKSWEEMVFSVLSCASHNLSVCPHISCL